MAAPTTPILDNFNDTEGPPMTGWADTLNGIRSNGATAQANAANSLSYYNTSQAPNCEAYATISTMPATNGFVSVLARLKDAGAVGTLDGYEGRFTRLAGTDTWRIFRFDNGVGTQLATASQEAAAGDGIWLHLEGSTLTLYRSSGGTWTQMCQVTDSTYPAGGFLGLSMSDTTARADDFGGGSFQPHQLRAVQIPFMRQWQPGRR
jgi:hypothetical protein